MWRELRGRPAGGEWVYHQTHFEAVGTGEHEGKILVLDENVMKAELMARGRQSEGEVVNAGGDGKQSRMCTRYCGLEQFVDPGLGDGSWSRAGVGDGMELDDVVNVFLILAQ